MEIKGWPPFKTFTVFYHQNLLPQPPSQLTPEPPELLTMAESSSASEIRIYSAVRGYHVYKEIWDPFIDDTFSTKHERGNSHDRYAMAVIPDDIKRKRVCGHLPREISKIYCLFVLCEATIVGRVTGPRRKTRAECGGMEIPCELTFKHGQKMVLDKLKLLLESY